MTRTALSVGLLWWVVATTSLASPQTTIGMTAAELVSKITREWPKSSSYRVRATLTRSATGSGARDVRQLLIKRHRDRTSSKVSFEQLWPKDGEGRTLVLDNTPDRPPQGFVYDAGAVTRLTSRHFTDRFFGSDLLIDDLVERFWSWPAPRLVGEESIGEYRCGIVEFRPPAAASYSRITAWLSPDLALGLRFQQFGPDNKPVKKIEGYRILKVGDRWAAGIVTVEPADGKSRTVLEATKYESDPALSVDDFTAEAIRRSAARR